MSSEAAADAPSAEEDASAKTSRITAMQQSLQLGNMLARGPVKKPADEPPVAKPAASVPSPTPSPVPEGIPTKKDKKETKKEKEKEKKEAKKISKKGTKSLPSKGVTTAPSTATPLSPPITIESKKASDSKQRKEKERRPRERRSILFGGSSSLSSARKKRNIFNPDAEEVPLIMEEILACLRCHKLLGLEGIFRLSGKQAEVLLLKRAYDKGSPVDLDRLAQDDVNTLTGALKSYFRDFAEPLMTFELYESFMTANGIPAPEERIFAIRQTIDRLPLGNRHVMAQLMLFLKEVASFSDSNKMTESNLAVVFAPTLLRPKVESIDMVFGNVTNSNELFTTLITDAERIFSKEPMLTAEEEDSLSKSEYSQVFGQVLKTGTIKLASNFLADLNNQVTTSTEQRRRSSTSAPGAAPTPHWMSIYDTADLASLPPALAAAPLPLPLSPAKPTSQSAYPGVSPGLSHARPPRPSLLQRHPPLQAPVASVSSPSASPSSSPPIPVCGVVALHSPPPPSGFPNPLFSFSEAALPPPMLPASLPPLSASSPSTLPDPDPPTERAPSPPSPPTSHTTTTPTTPVLLKPPGLSSIAAAPLPPPISSSSSPSVSLPVSPSPPFPVTPTASQSSSLAASSPVASSSPPVASSPLSSSSPTPALASASVSASAEKTQPTIDQLLALILRGQMPYVQKYLLSQPPDDRVRIKDALYARLAELRQTPQP